MRLMQAKHLAHVRKETMVIFNNLPLFLVLPLSGDVPVPLGLCVVF